MKIDDLELCDGWHEAAVRQLTYRSYAVWRFWFNDSKGFSAHASILADRTGISLRHVRTCLAEIESKGFIERDHAEPQKWTVYKLPAQIPGRSSGATDNKLAKLARSRLKVTSSIGFAQRIDALTPHFKGYALRFGPGGFWLCGTDRALPIVGAVLGLQGDVITGMVLQLFHGNDENSCVILDSVSKIRSFANISKPISLGSLLTEVDQDDLSIWEKPFSPQVDRKCAVRLCKQMGREYETSISEPLSFDIPNDQKANTLLNL